MFWVFAVALLLISLVVLLWPLYFHSSSNAGRQSFNQTLFVERREALEAERDAYSAEEFERLMVELQRDFLGDSVVSETSQATNAQRGWLVGASLLVPLLALLIFADFGLSLGSIREAELAGALSQADPRDEAGLRVIAASLTDYLDENENNKVAFLLGQSHHARLLTPRVVQQTESD